MIKNCAVNEHALAILDPIRDRFDCSYSHAILKLSQQSGMSDIDQINKTFRAFQDAILEIMDGSKVDKLFLDIIRIIIINRSTGNYTDEELDNINKLMETLFDNTRNEVK